MIRAIRGTYDILPGDVALWQAVETEIRGVFQAYGFGEIRTPIFESTELFVRGVGEDTDIVSKEMYTFTDKDESSSLTLRPEGTAPVVRAYIEHQMDKEARMMKLYYIGPMFRRERPQKGRYRQFVQAGAEVLSATDNPAIEAESIEMLMLLLDRLHVADPVLSINSIGCGDCRPRFIESLRTRVAERAAELCDDCQRRCETNPLRVFDCKKEKCQPVLAELPTITASLCEACAAHFETLQSYLRARQLPYRVNSRLVRGFDYYTRTTFEITAGRLGSQNSVLGGGRYDGLTQELDGPPTKGFGFAIGFDRLILSIAEPDKVAPQAGPELFFAPMGEAAFLYVTHLVRKLRAAGRHVYVDFDGRSLKSQMRLADKLRAQAVVIVGDDELKSGQLLIREMATREQRSITEDQLLLG